MESGAGRDRFDEMIVDIDSRLFDVQMLISRFIMELMEEWPDRRVDIAISVPIMTGDAAEIRRIASARLNTEGNHPLVFTDSSGETLAWEELDVASQYVIANHIHGAYVSKKLGDQFRGSKQ